MASNAATLESLLLRAWQRRGVLACMLWPLSLLFGALGAMQRNGYRSGRLLSSRLPAPVIVVGNLFVGGTGKTPLVIWLVHALRNAGYVPGVISRGYGTRHDSVIDVAPDALPAEVGDEPLLIAQRAGCPVMVGRDRVAAARALLQKHPAVNVIVSDDGLQHYRLQRDVEIVLFDERGAGNGWLLPAGPLREPVSRRRDFTVVNAARTPPGVAADIAADSHRMRLVGGFAEALVDPTRRIALGDLSGRILAAAGIGNPERFFSMLRAAGLTIRTMALPDHHDFRDDPFRSVHADVILITEKDAVKCRQIEALKADSRLWVVPVAAQIDGPLAQLILEKLHGHPTA
ncbi:tetraacyldisaccharide 4'-kinase [Actimicrobium sp. GrIS 1.19]|uniref:tetraacyldisaccharide 4'-kinase n=1 Tax=Actimicrobium sp. GrIS 1.19 TaxID=3071708 RepID=UPI002E0A4017|nr:tetraacyldisaccharide 4'-kinase [Actimicrobium sp. GrIS 1.19]